MFTLEVSLTKTGIEFNNTQDEFSSYVSFLMDKWKRSMIEHVPPLLSDDEFNDYVQ